VGDLSTIAYTTPEDRNTRYLLGHAVRSSDIHRLLLPMCPFCVRDLGYIAGYWDLRWMIGCSIHGVWALTACPDCGRDLDIYRPEMLVCRCGAILDGSELRQLEPSLYALVGVLRTRILNLFPLPCPTGDLPTAALTSLPLRSLILVIECLGALRVSSMQQSGAVYNPANIMSAAAYVLSDWPIHFFELLTIMARRPVAGPYDIRRQFAPLYDSLLRQKGNRDIGDFSFLRLAFLEFLGNHQADRAADPRLMRELRNQVRRRYVSPAELARSLQVDPRTVKRLLVSGASARTRMVAIDTRGYTFSDAQVATVLPVRKAAARLCIPVSVFRELICSSVFVPNHRIRGQVGFDERDVAIISDSLLNMAREVSAAGERFQLISLHRMMRMKSCTPQQRALVFSAFLSGALTLFRPKRISGIQDLFTTAPLLSNFLTKLNARSDLMNAGDASATLGCEFASIVRLVQMQLLSGIRSGPGWEISRSSVDRFRETYAKLSSLASELRTSSRLLARISRASAIRLLFVRLDGRRQEIFLPIVSRDELIESFHRNEQTKKIRTRSTAQR
jgi:hypothetical protein